MHTARVATRRPHVAVLGRVLAACRLEEMGIAIRHEQMADDIVGELDEEAGVLRIRIDAPIDDQIWLLQQAWNWINIGPHACPFARVVPKLRLVIPAQREDDSLLA